MEIPEDNIDYKKVSKETLRILNHNFGLQPTLIEQFYLRHHIEDAISDYERVENKEKWGFDTEMEAVSRFFYENYGYNTNWMFQVKFEDRFKEYLAMEQERMHHP